MHDTIKLNASIVCVRSKFHTSKRDDRYLMDHVFLMPLFKINPRADYPCIVTSFVMSDHARFGPLGERSSVKQVKDLELIDALSRSIPVNPPTSQPVARGWHCGDLFLVFDLSVRSACVLSIPSSYIRI